MEDVNGATEAALHRAQNTLKCQAVWLRFQDTGLLNLKVHWSDSTQRGTPVTLKTSEYLAKLQSHHYKCHLSQLQRRADMPIK